MGHEDFLELFYCNLKGELGNDKFVNSVEKLIGSNKFTKNNFLKLLEEEYYE